MVAAAAAFGDRCWIMVEFTANFQGDGEGELELELEVGAGWDSEMSARSM